MMLIGPDTMQLLMLSGNQSLPLCHTYKVLVAQIDQNRRDAQNERECCILRPDRLASYTRQDHEN